MTVMILLEFGWLLHFFPEKLQQTIFIKTSPKVGEKATKNLKQQLWDSIILDT